MSGLPENKKNDVIIKGNGSVSVINLTPQDCAALIDSIHSWTHFGKKLYCNGYIPLTPEKIANPGQETPTSQGLEQTSSTPQELSPQTPADIGTQIDNITIEKSPVQPVNTPTLGALALPAQSVPKVICSSPRLPPDLGFSKFDWSEETDDKVVRRHSISLMNRTPPKHSLAADIHGSPHHQANNRGSKSIMSSIKDIQDAISDFNSCQSTEYYSSAESSDDLKITKTSGKGKKAKKRKAKVDYTREDFLKKLDTKPSPNK